MSPKSFLPLVEDFIAQAQKTNQARLNMSFDQFRYFWTRLEHVLGASEVNRCARAVCRVCGHEHFFADLLRLTRLGEERTGKCGHSMAELLVVWSG